MLIVFLLKKLAKRHFVHYSLLKSILFTKKWSLVALFFITSSNSKTTVPTEKIITDFRIRLTRRSDFATLEQHFIRLSGFPLYIFNKKGLFHTIAFSVPLAIMQRSRTLQARRTSEPTISAVKEKWVSFTSPLFSFHYWSFYGTKWPFLSGM